MNEETKPTTLQMPENGGAPQPVAVVAVELYPNGDLQVKGSIHNKIQAVGMLEFAKGMLVSQAAEPKRVMPATMLPMPKRLRI